MKLKVFNLAELDKVLKGVLRIVEGCCIEATNKGLKISVSADNKIRSFITTSCAILDTKDDNAIQELCFESISKLVQSIAFIMEIDNTKDEIEFGITDKFLTYNGYGAFKLKLDKKERVLNYITPPIKAELTELFYFKLTQTRIQQILKYSNFNVNTEVKLYIYLKDGELMCDIDNRSEAVGRLSSVSIPLTKSIKGSLDSPFVLDINDLKRFNIFDQNEIKACLTDKCLKVCSSIEDSELNTNVLSIVRLLKD